MHHLKKKNQCVQRTHGTKSITGISDYCMLYRPMLLVLKTVNPQSHNQTVIFQGSSMVGKYHIAYLGIILVNIQDGQFSPIHQEMRLITDFEKAFKNPCFEVIQRPFYWSTHIFTRIYCLCVSDRVQKTRGWQHISTIKPWWVSLEFWQNCTHLGLQTGRVRADYFRIKLLKCANITFFHIAIVVFYCDLLLC